MILVFGGTTEGRMAVTELEEAGQPFYYSTRGEGQTLKLVNGQRLTGAMEPNEMAAFCSEHDIRLLVDAAHPFAEELHRNVLHVAHRVGIPVVRFDRIFPPHSSDIVYCKHYDDAIEQLEAHHIDRLLALTGVQTIRKLHGYWSKHECWCRILDRESSKALARKYDFPEDHLVYYEEDDTPMLLEQLRPQAILTKESGLSGGFSEKIEAARKAGVRVFVVERPAYPPPTHFSQDVHIEIVDGPHGLRRTVERLLPEFYPLKSGLTTGTCATAAAIAATRRLLTNETPRQVTVVLPNGESISVPVDYTDGHAFCKKEAGDDPDVTNGLEIRAEVSITREENTDIVILGGKGVGRFTLPGFDFPPGEPAINKSPRQMITANIKALLKEPARVEVTISVPQGEEIAQRTFNPRLGIEGGISIIGVSGIVKPFSEEAFIESIHKCMEVAKAAFADTCCTDMERVVLNSGAKSERYVKALYPTLPRQAFVEYGNYIGETLKMARELGFSRVTLGVMLGKAVKLAEGQLDTHSKKGTMNKDFICQMLDEASCQADLTDMTLARELWQRIEKGKIEAFCRVVIRHCLEHCQPLVPQAQLTLLLIDDDGTIHSL
jgi:cobalt-precorrin-5B (C1)-methyltransferase